MNGTKHEAIGAIKNATILVVDDERANVLLLEKMLAGDGYSNILQTQDSREVEPLYKANRIDLIILDLNMPHLDGFDVLQRLREIENDALPPILVLTAQQANSYRHRALENGARDYLTKPFDRIELLARVKNLLEVQLYNTIIRHQNVFLEQKVQERTRELNDTRLQVIQRLGRAAEYRDNETGLHIIRMSHVSQLLATALGFDNYRADLLLNASPMHDIGKIGIPDQILLKPGKLTPEEWDVMKRHSTIGADILDGDDSELLSMAKLIAESHHERWDGGGYPAGLREEQIPQVARIVAVADVFDALVSERPYKAAWPQDKAVEYIVAQKGQHFDPDVVTAFESILGDIAKINAEYAEPAFPPVMQSANIAK